jgi:hypothetical protein
VPGPAGPAPDTGDGPGGAAPPAGAPAPPGAPEEGGRPLRRAATLTAGLGAAYAVLFLLSYWLLSDLPGPRAPDDAVVAFYAGACCSPGST